MKYFILFIFILVVSACTSELNDLPEAKPVIYIPGYTVVYEFEYQGHTYLYSYRGAMIHSESCKSPKHYDN